MLGHLIIQFLQLLQFSQHLPHLLSAVEAGPPADCPSAGAVVAELERLGNGSAIAAHGTPELTIRGSIMHIALRGRDGTVSGVREISAPASCAERASVAAVVLSAWVGAWRSGSFPEVPPASVPTRGPDKLSQPTSTEPEARSPSAPSASAPRGSDTSLRSSPASRLVVPPAAASTSVSPPASPSLTSAAPSDGVARISELTPRAPSARRVQLEVGGFGLGMHDGDAGTWGIGMQAGLRFAGWLGLDTVFVGGGERERALVRGQAAYRLYSFGLGMSARRQAGRGFADLGVLSDLTYLSVEGKSLNPGRQFSHWGMAVDARSRLGFVLSHWRPFLFVGTSYALRAQRLTLDDYPDYSTTLSRWNFSLGLGLAYWFESNLGETKPRQAPPGTFE